MTGAELIFNNWTERVEPAAGDAGDAGSPDASAGEYRLRPVWQRAALASAQYAVGAFIAYLLVSMRSRLVRRLYVVPRTAVDAAAPFAPKLKPTEQPTLRVRECCSVRDSRCWTRGAGGDRLSHCW